MPILRSSSLSRRRAGRLFALAAVLAACAAVSIPAHAQCTPGTPGCNDDGTGPGVDGPPRVHVHPGTIRVAQPSIPVTVTMQDELDLAESTLRIVRTLPNGTTEDVTSQFSFSKWQSPVPQPFMMQGSATGTVALSAEGAVQLTARICDVEQESAERCTTSTAAVFRMSLPGVEVTPDGLFFSTQSGAAAKTHTFTVTNRGSDSATFVLSVECRNEAGEPVAGCSVQPRVWVGAGGSGAVGVSYPANRPGGTVSVALTARHAAEEGVQDGGWVEVAVRGAVGESLLAPQVAAVELNAGATVERSECVTVATALRGAYECGDLRVVHGLPAHRTYNRGWAPVLVYNSQQAHPTPTVYADVTLADGSRPPQRVEVLVRLRDGTVRRASYPGTQFLPGLTRRVGVQWDGLGMPTGVYGYTLQVINHFEGVSVASEPAAGELAVVNRAASPFGAGWWVAGWEQFVCVDCHSSAQRRLWVGGDGSTRVYTSTPGGGTWIAPSPDGPADTITVLPGGGYARRLRGGGQIEYSSQGEHVRTVNRLGQATGFDVQGGRLVGITVPVPPGREAAPGWTFAYENFSPGAWRLKTVTATAPGAPARAVALSHGGGDWRVSAITDPDGLGVEFAYLTGTYQRRMRGQRDRRRTWTYYGYDGVHGKLTAARTQMKATGADAAVDLTTGFVAAEGRGVARDGSTAGNSVSTSAAYTRLDGPRPEADVVDQTFFWLGRDGRVRRIRNPVGAETHIGYGDPRFPALATEVTTPGGVMTRAWYDERGRTVTTTVFGQYRPGESSTTSMRWDKVCDRPTMVTSAVADTTWTEYDPNTCNPLWQRLGRDRDRTVTFAYYPAGHPHAGMMDSIVGPRDEEGRRAVEKVEYDARGNLRMTRSPLGFLTLHETDALGRDTAVYTPVADDNTARDPLLLKQYGARQTTVYDTMGRPRITVSYGPAITHPAHNGYGPGTTGAESLRVVTEYDAEGIPKKVSRTVSPNPAGLQAQVTEYEYDAAGRRTDEWTNGGIHQHFEYDQGGNVVRAVTPRLHTIISRYDAAGRLVRREVPETVHARTSGSCPPDMTEFEPNCERAAFPFHPNSGTGYRVPAEWTTYRYDPAGNMVRAENADAIVERTYYPNGQVRTDSTRIRDFTAGFSFSQVYGIEYGYHEGRLTRLIHPANLAGAAATDVLVYDPRTSALAAAEDRNGNVFWFDHDKAGRLTQIRMPGEVVDSIRYDLEGRRVWRVERSPRHAAVPLQHETFVYDARGKVLAVTAPPTLGREGSTFRQWYSGLGSLVMTDWVNGSNPQWQRERFTTDPLGNTVSRQEVQRAFEDYGTDNPDFAYTMDSGYGRVVKIERVDPQGYSGSTPPLDQSWFRYDMAGNQETTYQRTSPGGGAGFTRFVDTRSFYGADDRLRAFQKYDDQTGSIQGASRGIWEEYRYDPLGRRVAVRTRRPPGLCNEETECFNTATYFVWAGDQLLWEKRETDAYNRENAGGTVSYFHAGGIDRPLTIWKDGVGTVVTHQSWRGQFSRGTFGSGTRAGESSDCTEYPATNGCIPVQWPGWNTTAWSREAARPHTIGDGQFWFGSLSVGMRDASGQQYMRNRYYNPQTGQFTQTDPIGLAGGLNSYGFAAGDPVSYSDPYGLCADHQFKKHGFLGGLGIGRTTCPGGLSRPEYRRIEGMIRNNFDAEAGGRLQGMLETGNVRRVRRTAHDREAEAFGGNEVRVADKFFATKEDGDAAWILGHEMGHNVQWEHGMLISEIGNANVQPDAGRLIRLMRTEGLENNAGFLAYQNDANMYACAHVTGMVERAGHCR